MSAIAVNVRQPLLRYFIIVTMAEPKALASRYTSSSTPYQKFVESPPKSFFKALFFGTDLGRAIRKMSASKAVPRGLKNQECEKGNHKKRPPIPYVPIVDEVQEAVNKGKEYSYKIYSPTRQSSVYPSGTQVPRRPSCPEHFLSSGGKYFN